MTQHGCTIRGPLDGPGTDDPPCGRPRVSLFGMCAEHEAEAIACRKRDKETRERVAAEAQRVMLKKIDKSRRASERRKERRIERDNI